MTEHIFNWGKYKGVSIHDVPEEYLTWLIETRERDIKLYQSELDRRESAVESKADMLQRLIKAGFRDMSKKLHPDAGGSATEFADLQNAYEKLKQLFF